MLVFFDDLDQAQGMDRPESAKKTLETMLGLSPAVAIVHLRTEVKFPDIRREHHEHVELEPLDSAALAQVLRRRLEEEYSCLSLP